MKKLYATILAAMIMLFCTTNVRADIELTNATKEQTATLLEILRKSNLLCVDGTAISVNELIGDKEFTYSFYNNGSTKYLNDTEYTTYAYGELEFKDSYDFDVSLNVDFATDGTILILYMHFGEASIPSTEMSKYLVCIANDIPMYPPLSEEQYEEATTSNAAPEPETVDNTAPVPEVINNGKYDNFLGNYIATWDDRNSFTMSYNNDTGSYNAQYSTYSLLDGYDVMYDIDSKR